MRWLISTLALIALLAFAATASPAQVIPVKCPPRVYVCPGAFPTDLTQTIDCRYKPSQRALDLVTGSITDQSVLSAAIFGAGAQIIQSPSEWGRTWYGYGRRVGARYTQAVGKGAAEYLIGTILNDDPRFLAYRDDPHVIARYQKAVCMLSGHSNSLAVTQSLDSLAHDGWRRFGHAWFDTITVRRSSIDGNGHRIPAFSRFAGEFGGAYAGYPWYPGAENTSAHVGERAAGAFATAAMSSFYTEYKPELTRLMGAVLRRGKSNSKLGGQP